MKTGRDATGGRQGSNVEMLLVFVGSALNPQPFTGLISLQRLTCRVQTDSTTYLATSHEK